MRTITEQELKDILDKHGKWLRNESGGQWVVSEYLGYEYWVSRFGVIASIFHPCGSLRKTPKFLKPRLTTNGYFSIAYKAKNHLVHRIVANEFIGPVKDKIVHHADAVKVNNFASNLVITNYSENNHHGHRTRKLNKKIITEMIRYYRVKQTSES